MVNVTIYSIHGSYGIWYSKSAKTVQMLHVRCYQPNIDTNSWTVDEDSFMVHLRLVFQKQTISPQMAVGQIHTNNIKYKKMPLSSIVHNFQLWTISQNWCFRWLSKQNWCFPCSTINVGVSQLSNNNTPPLPAKTPTVIVVSMKIMTSSPGTPLGMVDSQQKLDQNQNPQDIYIYIIIYIYISNWMLMWWSPMWWWNPAGKFQEISQNF